MLSIDEVDINSKSIKKIGMMRVIVYLEDLGPVDQLQNVEEGRKKELIDLQQQQYQANDINRQVEEINNQINVLPSENVGVGLFAELKDIEYKVIWELENWKKTEETKFNLTLKQKEIQMLNELQKKQRDKDIEKEKVFKKAELGINQIEMKLKKKAQELQQREHKLVLLEDELRKKVEETIRQLAQKDQEMQKLVKKNKDEQVQQQKERQKWEEQMQQQKKNCQKLELDIKNMQKQQEKSQLMELQNTIQQKDKEIMDLKKKNQQVEELKQQYQDHYEKMRKEVIAYKRECERLSTLQLVQPMVNQKQKYEESEEEESEEEEEEEEQKENYYNSGLNGKDRLIEQRRFLIKEGGYQQNDPLIMELDRQINQ